MNTPHGTASPTLRHLLPLLHRGLQALGLGLILLVVAPEARAQLSLDDRVNGLAEMVKKKNDDQAIVIIEGLSQSFATLANDEEKKKVVAAVEKVLNARREDGDDKLFQATVNSFANMGELGNKATVKNLKVGSVDKRPGVLASALRSLSFHKNAADVKTLTDYLVNSNPLVVAGAADGLGAFADLPEKTRKPVVEELVKNYAVFASAATASGADNKEKARAKERLNIVEKSFQDSLKKLTGQDFKDGPAAQRWFNDNKGKKWDAPAKG